MTTEERPNPRTGPARPPSRPRPPEVDPEIWSDDAAGPRRPPRRAASAVAEPYDQGDPIDPIDDGHDYVDLPAESRVPHWVAVLVVIGLLVGAVLGGGYWWYGRQVDPPGPRGEVVSVTVPEGSSTSRIADIVSGAGVVGNSTLFNLYLGRHDAGPFQAGTYRLHRNETFDQARAELEAGPSQPAVSKVAKVTIPEGFTVAKTVARIHQKVPRISVASLQAALDQGKVPSSLKPPGTKSYEGLLFPATYEIDDGMDAVQVLSMMAAEMETRVDRFGIEAARSHIKQRWGLDLTAYDMLKVASMVQYEAAVPADAPKIAAVTYNRLQKSIALGFDSTSIYEAGLRGTQPDYKTNSPYNTRLHTGLPPTPISSPGETALDGAMGPADGDWLYFVLTGPKEVTYSVTYQDFLAAKALCHQRGLGCG
jgi:UPF0755 protein